MNREAKTPSPIEPAAPIALTILRLGIPRRLIVVATVVAMCAACGSSTHASHPEFAGAELVLGSSASEEGPSASGRWLAWMESDGVNPVPSHSATNVYVRSAKSTIRVNPPGTQAETGGIDGNRMVLQIIRHGTSKLALFDFLRRRLSYLPRTVNDAAWLWRPDLDGHRVLYGAIVPGTSATQRYEIRLADLSTGRVRLLASVDGHAAYAAPGQLRGEWATWVLCPDNVCNVYRENLSTGVMDGPPDPAYLSHWQFGSAVSKAGVVYYGRGLSSCGETQIRRWDGRNDEHLLSLPRAYAFQYAYLGKGSNSLYFDMVRCGSTARSDIYRLQLTTR